MPVTSKTQIEKMITLCGASLTPRLEAIINKYADNPNALLDAGIDYAIEQITELLENGVDGIHLYTMNNPLIAKRISKNVSSLFSKESRPNE
jgi:methylenetetrahydrofolate reductase (NADPH)